MRYVIPGQPGSIVSVEPRYENFIGGKWHAPTNGKYRVNLSPATAQPITEVPDSTAEDIELALDAAHAVKDSWGEKSAAERAEVLNAVADAIEAHKEELAVAESWENGKPVRETLNADIPLVVDHFRYFAAAARAEEGRSTEIDKDTVAYHFREPLGVVGQIIPFNFPLLMAAWKLAPALAAGNCSVMKPASPTPWSILKLCEVIEDIVLAGVINVVNGPGAQIGKALATNPRIAKIGFTGETVTGRLIMQYAAQNLIPSTVELGGKSPNIFFSDVMARDDEFLDKAVEGLVLYAFNKGEVCTCPSRALTQEDIYDKFMGRALERIAAIKQGNPLDTDTQIGPQVSLAQLEKIASYVEIGRKEGAEVSHRWRAHQGRRRVRGRLLLPADRPQGRQQHARLPGRDLRTGPRGHNVPRRCGRAGHRERHAVRPRGRRVDARRQPRVHDGPQDQGRSRVDELLPPVPGGSGFRWVQDLRHRPGEPPDDARPLQPDQEPAGQLQHQAARSVLSDMTARLERVTATPAARRAIADLCATVGGPVMFVQSGGCCAGSTPMCFPDGEFIVGEGDVLLGDIDGCPFYIDARLDQAWGRDCLVLDVGVGPPEGFSLGAGEGRHFVTTSAGCAADRT